MASVKEAIKSLLDARAAKDELFAKSYMKPEKNIDKCVSYVFTIAKKQATSGMCAMTDDEVVNIAIHYYDEDSVEIDEKAKPSKVTVGDIDDEVDEDDDEVTETISKPVVKAKTKKVMADEGWSGSLFD